MFKRPRTPLVLAAVGLAVFAPLFFGVMQHARWLLTVDQPIVDVAVAAHNAWLTPIVLAITALGNPPVVVTVGLVLAGLLLLFHHPRHALLVALSITVGSGLNHVIKQWIRRPRPFVADPSITPLTHAGGFSFPSGHSSGAMLLWGTVILVALTLIGRALWRRLLISLSTVMIALIGLSRIYVQVHFPTDVLAGWGLGLFWLMLLWWLLWPWLQKD